MQEEGREKRTSDLGLIQSQGISISGISRGNLNQEFEQIITYIGKKTPTKQKANTLTIKQKETKGRLWFLC